MRERGEEGLGKEVGDRYRVYHCSGFDEVR